MKLSLAVIMIVAVGAADVAHADNKDKAESLFKQGKKLMGEKRYADACEAFEKSYKLDPGLGTQLNIAKCYEDWGKIGRAYLAYQAAEKAANEAKDPRTPKIRDLVAGLEPEVPHLTIKLPKDAPADLKVTLDSRAVETLNEPFVVDPGPHTIEWTFRGAAKKRSKIVAIDRGGESEVSLDVSPAKGGGGEGEIGGGGGDGDMQVDTQPEPARSRAPGRTQRMLGIALGGAGVVAIGVSSYLTLSARSDYNSALDTYCNGMKDNCDMTGLEITRDARSTANKATIVFLVGAAMVGGGAALYFLAPKATETQTVYLTPALSPDSLGLVLGGTL